MSYALSYCTEYKVKHSDKRIGNWQQETTNLLLQWLDRRNDHNYYLWTDEDIDFATVLEMDKEGVEEVMEILEMVQSWKDIPEETDDTGDWSMPKRLRDNLIMLEETKQLTPKDVHDFLEDALKNAEPTIKYVRFEWR